VHQELGLRIDGLRLLLPRFRYRAVMDGVVENEMCPVFVATTYDAVRADPLEVAETAWEPWAEFRAGVLDGSRDVSQWCREQVAQLPADPLSAPPAAAEDLPPAARTV
jgi:isopentenyl-diphosphate delta-isomerase